MLNGANSSWFQEHRIAWIRETVEIYGFINRVHVMRKFSISMPCASHDLSATLARWPGLMTYNLSTKRFELTRALPTQE